ncbi:protein translocase subunit SecF [Patescibacteria group bacterium]
MIINFVRYRKIYLVFSGLLILVSLLSLIRFGLDPGIDFTGGSILELEYENNRTSNQETKDNLSGLDLGEIYIQPTGEKGVILRMKSIDEDTHQKIIEVLGNVQEVRFESIGPTIGMELKQKTATVALFAILAMVLYITFAFRGVSGPIKSWRYAIVTLFIISHDVLVPLGIFAALGNYYGIQITIPVVVAFLTIIGYAINNVVVVFDRLRENLTRRTAVSFEETVDLAINQTISRQLGTSLTTLFPLLFIYFIGGETLKYFALALIFGIITGTYSSIFLASPILVSWLRLGKNKIDKQN